MSYMTQRSLTDDEKAELADLTAAVTTALEARRDWLDAKMHETSKLQVGDDIYDINSGSKLGKVSGLYRYWRDRNDLIDTNAYCEYEYESLPGYRRNTSSQSGRLFGTREEALLRAEMQASRLREGLTP
jgi:hypothetical protein